LDVDQPVPAGLPVTQAQSVKRKDSLNLLLP